MPTDISTDNRPMLGPNRPTPPRKRGRPKLPPGVKGAYKGRPQAPIQPQATEETIKEGGLPSNREYPEVLLPEQAPQAPQTSKMDQGQKPDLALILAEREQAVERVIKTVLPATKHAPALVAIIVGVSDGRTWERAAEGTGLAWPTWGGYLRQHPILQELWHTAQASGDAWRAQHLEGVTYERATDGWLEPVFHRGEVCGHVRRFCSRMAEIHLRACNPGRYNVRPEGESAGSQVQVNVVWHKE